MKLGHVIFNYIKISNFLVGCDFYQNDFSFRIMKKGWRANVKGINRETPGGDHRRKRVPFAVLAILSVSPRFPIREMFSN